MTVSDGSACKHEDTVILDAKDPTCTDAGYTGDTYCRDCKEKIADATGLEKNMTVSMIIDNSVSGKPVVVTIFVNGPTK